MTKFPIDGTGRIASEREHPTTVLIGPAGGDLAGSFPNPTITTVNGQPASSVVTTVSPPGNRLAVSQEAPLNVEWPEYGADPAATDNTAAIQAAINALPASITLGFGGEIFLPNRYKCANSLDLTHASGKSQVKLRGDAGPIGDSGGFYKSRLLFTGTGSGRFLDCRSSQGLVIEGLAVQYDSTSFTGTLIDFQHDSSGQDAALMVIRDSLIAGDATVQPMTADRLINLNEAILGNFENNAMGYAKCSVKGNDVAVPAYSNAHTFKGNTFDHCATAALMNAGQNWCVIGNNFEGTGGATKGMKAAYACDYNDLVVSNLSLIGNWFGDFTQAAGGWLDFSNQFTAAASIIGNFINGGVWGINQMGSGVIIGNSFGVGTNCVVLPVYTVSTIHGLTITGNDWTGSAVTVPVANMEGHDVTVFGNSDTNGVNRKRREQISFAGHFYVDHPEGVSVGATVDASICGTGASVVVSGSDTAGEIAVTTGGAPGAASPTSPFATILFAEVFDIGRNQVLAGGSHAYPLVVMTARSQVAGSLTTFWNASNDGGINLFTNTVLAGGATYVWDYWVVSL